MTQVTVNGNTYSDDRTAAKDMNAGGVRTHLLPMISDVMVELTDSAAAADAAIAAAIAAAASAAALTGTSTTSVAIATGSKGFTTQADKQFAVGVWVLIYQTSTPANYMFGQVTAYSGTSLTVDVQAIGGSGTIAAWTISVAGIRGATGATGPVYSQTRSTKTAGYSLAAGDQGMLIDFTTGSVTLGTGAAATLGSAFWCEVRNSSTGDILFDPNSSETIDGLTSFYMYPGEHRRVFCTGSVFVSLVLNPFYKAFTASGSFVKPPGYSLFGGLLWAAGGGGAVGASAPGGGGGSCAQFTLPAASFGTSEVVTLGAGGAGSTTSTPTAGGASTLGALVRANGARAATTANGGTAYLAENVTFSGIAHTTAGASGPTLFGGGDGAQSSSGYGTVYGGAAGAQQGSTAIATTFGGAGGAPGTSGVGSPGTAPGGGGGATSSGANGGAGADGQLRIWGVI